MKKYLLSTLAFLLLACSGPSETVDRPEVVPSIFPDYTDVTIPYNIAPLNFRVEGAAKTKALFHFDTFDFTVNSSDGDIVIPPKEWKNLLSAAVGKKIKITIREQVKDGWKEYLPFSMQVAKEPVDAYLAYRLIEPGYSLWNEMGIYQRSLSDYEETAIYENKQTEHNCVNCHSFCKNNPDTMLFHMRASHSGTVFIQGENVDVFDTKTDRTMSPLVYPSWHPSGKYVAFSVNKTTQDFHPSQRVEVFDLASDVVVYDLERRTIVTTPLCFSKNNLETFPSFSADGKTLYFCTAESRPIPDSLFSLRYNLCSLSFDARNGRFGTKVDTLYNARIKGKSVSFPRVSPNGRFLLYTLSDYGTFPIWHKEADLHMINLETKEEIPLTGLNSDETESYHSWSSNGHWIVFSSRRLDGLYTRPFIAYVSEDGAVGKPFLLPQKETHYYTYLMKSYNIPEFITHKAGNRAVAIRKKATQRTVREPVAFLLEN